MRDRRPRIHPTATHGGPLFDDAFGTDRSAGGFSEYSEAKAAQIDDEVSRIVEEAHQRVRRILSDRRTVLDDLARLLSQKESVQGEELRQMLAAAVGIKAAAPDPSSAVMTVDN